MNTSTANFSVTLDPSKPSRALALYLSILYLFAAICILLISIPVWLNTLLFAVLIYLGVKAVNQYALFKANTSIVNLVCFNENKCKIRLKNGKEFQVNIISADFLFNYFIVLFFKNNAKVFKATIAKDAVSQEQFYALRLYLRSNN